MGDLWQTCFFVPGPTKSECASWVQAWGSILAIFAAVCLALWQQRYLLKNERAKVLLRAQVVGTSMLIQLEPVLGGLESIARTAEQPNGTNVGTVLWAVFEGLPFPTEADMLVLAEHDPECARALLRGRNYSRQVELLLRLTWETEKNGLQPQSEQWTWVTSVASAAALHYGTAKEQLESLVPH